MSDYLYLLPFFCWIPLTLLAASRTGEQQAARVTAPIRVDLLFLIPLTTVTFSGLGIWAFFKRGAAAKTASVLLLALSAPILINFVKGTRAAGMEEARMASRPASRVIINDKGQFWLMIKCQAKVECVYASADLGATSLPATIKATYITGAPKDLIVSEWNAGRISVNLGSLGTRTFLRAPVPYREEVLRDTAVTYRGSWSSTRLSHNDVELLQMWLWNSGDRWLAYVVRRRAGCDSTVDFPSASPFVARGVMVCRLASSIGMERQVQQVAGRRHRQRSSTISAA